MVLRPHGSFLSPQQGSKQLSESGGVGPWMATLPSFLGNPETLFQSGQRNMSASNVQTRVSRAGSEPEEFVAGMCESDHLGCRMLMGQGEAHTGPREEEAMPQTVSTVPLPSKVFHCPLT